MAKRVVTYTPQSSAVRRAVWSNGRVVVQFKSGASYAYKGVSRQKMTALMKASSAGAFINRNLKPKAGKPAKLGRGPGTLKRALGTRSSKSGSGSSNS